MWRKMAKKNEKNAPQTEEAQPNNLEQTQPEEQEQAEEAPVQEEPNEMEKIQADLEAQKDLLLRTAAEFDNYKKRTARETERIGAETRAGVVKTLLPLLDNFLRAQDNAGSQEEDYKKGIELCIKQFIELLQKLGLEEIESLGKPFDPQIHYAVSQVEDESAGENTVVQVLQKGYRMGDIVLRPAMVTVANC